MATIGEIVTQEDLKNLAEDGKRYAKNNAFIAPTVYKFKQVGGWNYYDKLSTAMMQWAYLNGYSTKKQTATGSIKFNTTGNETMGIDVDFYYYMPFYNKWVNAPYEWIKTQITKAGFTCPIRFKKTDGSGYYYAVLDNRYFAITATVIKTTKDKVAKIDELYRVAQVVKYKYNFLSTFLTELSKKSKLTPTEQQLFNQGVLQLNNMERQIRSMKGVNVQWSNGGNVSGIGIAPLLIIAVIVLVAGLAAWTLPKIAEEVVRWKAIDSNNDLEKFRTSTKILIQKDVTAGKLTPQQGKELSGEIDKNINKAQDAAKETATENRESIFDKAQSLLLIGAAVYFGVKILNKNN